MVPPGQATTIERSRPNRCRGSGLCCLLLVGNTSEMLLGPAMFRVNSSLELASSDHPLSIHRNFKLIELNPIVDPHEIIMKSSWNHPPNQSYPAACSQTSVVLCNSFSLCAFTAWKLREICPFETEVKLDISSCGVINNSMMGWSNPDGG